MALSWTKAWSSADDGTVFGGSDLENIQGNIDSQCVTLAGSQTLSGNNTFSGTNTFTGTNSFTQIAVTNFIGNMTITGALTVTGDIYTTAWGDYSETVSITGFSSYKTKKVFHKRVGDICFWMFEIEGTSNSTSLNISTSISSSGASLNHAGVAAQIKDNGATQSYGGLVSMGSSDPGIIFVYSTMAGAAWTNSGDKKAIGSIWYEAA